MSAASSEEPSILIIEDEKNIRYILRRAIENRGWRATELDSTNMSVDSVVATVHDSLATAIILDGTFQDGTALDVIDQLGGSNIRPTVVYSGTPEIVNAVTEEYLNKNTIRAVHKPADIEDILTTIGELLALAAA